MIVANFSIFVTNSVKKKYSRNTFSNQEIELSLEEPIILKK